LELVLQNDLPHQQKAVDVICDALNGANISAPAFYYLNPSINIYDPNIAVNIKTIQMNVHPDIRGSHDVGKYLGLDIKMETGTGKTYVYTKTIFELHKRFGLNKFIIAVPTLPIKAGTRQFIADEYVKRHFSDVCGYNSEIDLGVLESIKKRKVSFSFPAL